MVLLMRLEVLGQLLDATREQGNLNLGRACIGLAPTVIADQCGFLLFEKCHKSPAQITRPPDPEPGTPSDQVPRRTGWPASSMKAGMSRPVNLPFGETVTSATAVVAPATEKLGHTKFASE